MTSDSDRRRRAVGRDAADWYVEIDANPNDREREAALVEWLERSPQHEAAFERCEAAMTLAGELAARDGVADEPAGRGRVAGATAAELVGTTKPLLEAALTRGQKHGRRLMDMVWRPLLGQLARPAVAWSFAAAAMMWAVAATVELPSPSGLENRSARTAAPPVGTKEPAGPLADGNTALDDMTVPLADAGITLHDAAAAPDQPSDAFDPRADALEQPSTALEQRADALDEGVSAASFVTWNPVALLPGQIVVDVHSVAVLPFDGVSSAVEPEAAAARDAGESAAAKRIAMQLYDEVLRQLSRIPGVYVADRSASAVYAQGEFEPDEIAAFLAVRGVVAADVAVDGRTVRVSLRMTDAANDGRRTQTSFERPLEELPAVKTAIVSNIADTLTSAAF